MSVQDLPVISKLNNFQSLKEALNFFMEIKFCKSDVYFLNRRKNVKVATYNFGSVFTYMQKFAMPFRPFYCHKCNNQHYFNNKLIGYTLFVKKATKTFQQTTQVCYF